MTTPSAIERLTWHQARSMTPIERFWHYVVEDADGCLIWAGAITEKGRPVFQAEGKTHNAYVWLWEQMMERPVKEDHELHHLCGDSRCVRFACLREMTHAEHMALHTDIGWRGDHNGAKTHCVTGHEFTEQNTWVEKNGKRHCRACRAATARRFRARQKASV
jgi:hypothetical protein